MRKQATILIPIILMLITTSLFVPQLPGTSTNTPLPARSASAISSTEININQTVSGVLNQYHPEAAYGIYLGPGQYNVSLTVAHTASLGLEVSRWAMNIPFTVASVPPGAPGVNSSTILLLPTFGPSLESPGDYVIRIYGGPLGSYSLRVQQISSFQAIAIGHQMKYTAWNGSRAQLFEAIIPAFGTYNVTLKTNNTFAFYQINTYEDDVFLPLTSSVMSGNASFLVPLQHGEFYLDVIPFFGSTTTIKGSISINSTTVVTINPGSKISDTISQDQEIYYYANLTSGYYYNITLQVPSTEDLDLGVFSPGTGMQPLAVSAVPTKGAEEKITNLVVFYFSSFAVNAQGQFQWTPGSTSFFPMGARPDRVLIGVRGTTVPSLSTAVFNLTLTRQPFPTLDPGRSQNVYLNATTGPYYKFYATTQNSPAVYNATYQYKVWGTSSWFSTIGIAATVKFFKAYPNAVAFSGLSPILIQHFFLTPDSFQTAANTWFSQFTTGNSTDNASSGSRNETLGIPPFAYIDSSPAVIGAAILNHLGNSAYNGTLSYAAKPSVPISIGTAQDDYLTTRQVSLFRVSLKAGHTYKVSLTYTSMTILSAIYSTSGFLQPTTPPLLSFFITTDPNLPENGYYYLFTPAVTGDYYIANTGGLGLIGPTEPEGSYTMQIQELSQPSLAVSVQAPASVKVGNTFTINSTVTNAGNYTAENVNVNLSLPGSLRILSPTGSKNLGNLPPGASVRTTWTVNSTAPGNYAIDIMASGGNVATAHGPSSVAITAPSLQLSINSPATASEGGSFQVQVTVTNNGNAAAGSTTVQITLPTGLTTSPSSQPISSLSLGQSQTLTWTVNAQTAGNYTITAKANEQYAGSATIVAAVSVPPTPPPWTMYLLAAAIISILVGFLGGYILASRRKKGSFAGNMPPPPASPSK